MKISQLIEGPCDVATKDDIAHMSGPQYDKYALWKEDCEDELRRTPLSGKRFSANAKDFRKTIMKQDEGTTVSASIKPTPKVVPVSAEDKAKADAQNKASDAKLIKKAPTKDVNRKRNYNDDGIQPPKGHHNTTANRWAESFDDYHGDMSKEEYDKTVKDSEMEYTVWVGGTEVNDYWLNYEDAVALYDKYKAQGYDDVQLDARIKKDVPQDIPMGIKPIPKEFHGSGINWDEVDESSLPGPDAFQKTRDLKLSLRRDLKKPLIHKPINKPKSGYHSNNATGYAESKEKKEDLLKGFDPKTARALMMLKAKYPQADNVLSALLADVENNEKDSDVTDLSQDYKMDKLTKAVDILQKEINLLKGDKKLNVVKEETVNEYDFADVRQKRIAIDTVKNPNKALLGGPSANEAEDILKTKFGYSDNQIAKLKGVDENIKRLKKLSGINEETRLNEFTISDLKGMGIKPTREQFHKLQKINHENGGNITRSDLKKVGINEDGVIVPGVNTTVDVKPGQTEIEAAKFGNGKIKPLMPKGKSNSHILFNLGLAEDK